MSIFGEKPLEHYFPLLAKDRRVKDAIAKEFGTQAKRVMAKLQSEEPLLDGELAAHAIIFDLIDNEADDVGSITALGAYDEPFDISIMKSGPIYFVSAIENDDIGYFSDLEAARDCAKGNYEPFITAYKEYCQSNR